MKKSPRPSFIVVRGPEKRRVQRTTARPASRARSRLGLADGLARYTPGRGGLADAQPEPSKAACAPLRGATNEERPPPEETGT
jgi:hypothetical protein